MGNVLKRTPAGAEEYAAVDARSELDGLNPSEAVRAAFERRPGQAETRDE